MSRFSAPLVLLLIASPFAVGQSASTSSDGTVVLFDGKDLSQWKGREDLWAVEDGAIVGRTSEEDPIEANTFLIWQGDAPSDFELVAQFKIEGGNSGIQYRSRVLDPETFVVGGYQADIDFANRFAGILYSEKTGRGILAERGEKVTIGPDGERMTERFADGKELGAGIHPGEWNEFRVVADGNHLTHYINGAKVSEVIDREEGAAAEDGVIALQLHRGPAMVVRFKNLTLRPLAAGR